MQHTTQTLTAPNGATLFAQAWEPDTAPRGVVVLVHGVAEHSGRYQHVAAFLVELTVLDGRRRLDGYRVTTLLSY